MKVAIASNRLLALFLFPTFRGGNSPDLIYFGLLLILSDSGKKIMKRIENIIQKKIFKELFEWRSIMKYQIVYYLHLKTTSRQHILYGDLLPDNLQNILRNQIFKIRFLSIQTWSSHPLQPVDVNRKPFRVCPRFHLTLRLFVMTKWPNIVTIWSSIPF